MFRILSIDGGGIRGVIPAVILQHLEKKAGKPISKMFDLLAGTSTGGILAAGLTVPDKHGRPKFSASDLLRLYVERGPDIFNKRLVVLGLFEKNYSHKPLEEILKECLGNQTLKSCLKPVLITSYEIEKHRPYFFKTSKAKKKEIHNHYLRDVARATSAAPMYFDAAVVKSRTAKPYHRVLIDGAVFAGNPAICAYAEAIKQGVPVDDILLVSIGTGIAMHSIDPTKAKGWGKLGWVRPLARVMARGTSNATDYQLRQLLPDSSTGNKQRYFRFNTRLDLASDKIDAADKTNIRNLKLEASKILATQKKEFARLLRKL